MIAAAAAVAALGSIPMHLPCAPRGRGLATKYAIVWSLLVGLLLGVSGLIAAAFAWQDTVQGVGAVQREKALAAAERIDHVIDALEQPLRWVVDDVARRDDRAPQALQIELLQLLRRQPAFVEVRWIDAAGRERLALSRLAMDVLDSGRDWSSHPLVQGARRDGVRFGAVEFRRGSEPHLAMTLAARGGGAVIWAVVNLKALGEITREAQPAAVGVAYVVDAAGQLLSHPDPSLVLRRTDMAGLPHVRAALAVDRATSADDARALDGTPVFAAAALVPRLGWTVIVEQPQRQALAPVWGSLARSAALTALGVALAVAASAWLAGRLVRPIRALQARAADIAAGQLDQRIELAGGDEVQALGEQFNRMAAKLQALYASLEARVADRTRELADANEAKSRFLAAASHDLRQPVHALGLFAGQLRQAPDHAAQRALVGDIERAVAAFEALLASLLDISRLDAGSVAVQRTPVALGPLLDRLAGGFAPAVAAKGLRLRTRSTALWVDSDPVLLERVLLNLLGNALRYTARGGVLLAARPRGAAVELWMVDTGIGIAPEHQAPVFDEFFRVPGVPADGEVGLGLGLAIVRRLVALLGHGLVLRSVLGRGSAFVLTLQRAAPAAPAALELVPLAAAEPLAGRRVLIVDDDAAVREATRGQLAQWGCEVLVAADGAQALARQAAGAPEIVLTDLRLADGEDGLAVAQRLRERAAVPVVVITGDTVPARLRAAREAGCTVLTKPLRPARLRAVLEALLPARPPR